MSNETLAEFTARHEALGHFVWTGNGQVFAYESEEDSDADAASGGELSDRLVIETWEDDA